MANNHFLEIMSTFVTVKLKSDNYFFNLEAKQQRMVIVVIILVAQAKFY